MDPEEEEDVRMLVIMAKIEEAKQDDNMTSHFLMAMTTLTSISIEVPFFDGCGLRCLIIISSVMIFVERLRVDK